MKLGDKVKDRITGFVGIATARCVYLNGCVQIQITPPAKNNETQKVTWIDEDQIEVLQTNKVKESTPSGGGFRNHPED